MAYTRVNWENYPSTNTPRNATNLNVMDAGIEDVDTRLSTVETGWVSANETWTYSSVDDPTGVITISGDVTSKYSLGMRIKFTNNSNVIYGIITKINYSSPNTTLTFLHEIDPTDSLALHLMQNSAITDNYYSNMKCPYGFPSHPDKWSITVIDTTQRVQSTPTQNVWYNPGGIAITVPIGIWDFSFNGAGDMQTIAGQTLAIMVTSISESASSETDTSMTRLLVFGSASGQLRFWNSILICKLLSITTKKTYYFIFRTDLTTMNYLTLRNATQAAVFKAICAYL